MFELKSISRESIPAALERAMRYRLLNDSATAESICEDILKTDPENEEAHVLLILAMADQFNSDHPVGMTRIKNVLSHFKDDYKNYYYSGIVCERRAKSKLENVFPGSKFVAYELIHDAMELFEKAEAIRPAGNDEAILRWNYCARTIMRYNLEPSPEDNFTPLLE